jgi:hypothetical protein
MATIETPTSRRAPSPETTRTPAATDLYYEEPSPSGPGWLLFSAIALGFAGVWAFFEGLLAIGDSRIYVGSHTFVFSDLQTWGWIVMLLGVAAIFAAFGIATGSELARWFGITVAALNGFGQLLFLDAQPWWGMAMFAVDMLVIYGLAVYGGRRFQTR